MRLDRLGDVILSTPAIAAVRAAYPDAHLAVMVRPQCREAVEGLPELNEVLLYDKDQRHRSVLSTVRFAWQLRRQRFDVAVILHPSHRSHWMPFLAGIPRRVGWDRKSGWLLTHRVPHVKQEGTQHESAYTLDVVRRLGIDGAPRSLHFPSQPTAAATVQTWLAQQGVRSGDQVIAMHPSASCVSKRWLPERFAAVADTLIAEGKRVVVVAGPDDRIFGEQMVRVCRQPVLNAIGQFSVAELGELLRRCALLISNDSGPVHVAVAVGTPVVDIFGRNQRGLSPLRWGPLGPHDQVLHKEVGCPVCLAHNCNIEFKCLTEISAQEVLGAAHTILNQGNVRGRLDAMPRG